MDRFPDRKQAGGLHWHRIVKVDHVFTSSPQSVLETAFRFFDENPDAPALLLFASVPGDRRAKNPFRNFTQAQVAILLARRERIDWLRNYAPFVAKETRRAYPEMERWVGQPPVPFTPTRFIPKPWTKEQIAQLDALPTLAIVHRPVTVEYRRDGKALNEQERYAAFDAGWAQAMAPLPRTEDGKLHPRAIPARLFYDHGMPDQAAGLVPLTRLLMHDPEPGAMKLNVLDPAFGFNTFNILGNMRHVHPMAQWALATMATWQGKDVSVTLDLRASDAATIAVFTPNTSPDNLARQHPGGDPVRFPLR